MNVFNQIDKFFSSLKSYIEINELFLIFVGLFLFTIFVVIITTSRAYEARLIKAIDMFNNYFIDNPQITEDNLVNFNNKMKSRKVPKQLRKQWQQFVLYREKKASEYMSFDTCVSIPIKNSTFKRDIGVMNSISWILAVVSFVVNLYMVLSDEVAVVLRQSVLTPIIIILLNIIVTIFLELRHNAIVSDLNQNYQYFEVNIDKATETLPEYVDYEVLFDKNEIKRGIPMLYAYLQKRAEMEKKELERARLKNVEHEKFNFDEAGVESSLVLERAMQEAENYIAERKKLMQDIEQINGDITQEEMNFRETTKEYQRQMQVSKETFDNFKSQLEEASSTIEVNYLKKQQQQELDRQRNLERDYDTATDRHKKVLESYQEELSSVEAEIKKARNTLERGMMSEFDTYSGKVYDEAMRVVEEREKDKIAKLKNSIKELEEKLISKNKEVENVYAQNQNLTEQINDIKQNMSQNVPNENQAEYVDTTPSVEPNYQTNENYDYTAGDYAGNDENVDDVENKYNTEYDNAGYEYKDAQYNTEPNYSESNNDYNEDNKETFNYTDEPSSETFNYTDEPRSDIFNNTDKSNDESSSADVPETFNYFDDEQDNSGEDTEPVKANDTTTEESDDEDEGNLPDVNLDDSEDEDSVTDEDADVNEEDIINDNKDSIDSTFTKPTDESKPKKKAGRPRKVVTEEKPKRGVGRPKKTTEPGQETKRGRGRPKKEVEDNQTTTVVETETKKRGRPKKEQIADIKPNAMTKNSAPVEIKKHRGRPKKESIAKDIQSQDVITENNAQTKRRGRPKKEEIQSKVEVKETKPGAKKRGRPKKETAPTQESKLPSAIKRRGRPKKNASVQDIDAYLKELDDEIAKESAKMLESEKALAKNATIKKKK